MSILNKRNAVVGWVVVKAGKRAAKRKAEEVAPAVARKGGAAAGVLAALGGLFLFWRKKRSGAE